MISRNTITRLILLSMRKGVRGVVIASPSVEGIIGLATRINQNGYFPAEVIKEKAHQCTGCISCAVMCPDMAISVYQHNSLSTQLHS